MSVYFYAIARNCVTCARDKVKLRRHNKPMKLFPSITPLGLVAIDILGELVEIPRKHKY